MKKDRSNLGWIEISKKKKKRECNQGNVTRSAGWMSCQPYRASRSQPQEQPQVSRYYFWCSLVVAISGCSNSGTTRGFALNHQIIAFNLVPDELHACTKQGLGHQYIQVPEVRALLSLGPPYWSSSVHRVAVDRQGTRRWRMGLRSGSSLGIVQPSVRRLEGCDMVFKPLIRSLQDRRLIN